MLLACALRCHSQAQHQLHYRQNLKNHVYQSLYMCVCLYICARAKRNVILMSHYTLLLLYHYFTTTLLLLCYYFTVLYCSFAIVKRNVNLMSSET